MKILVYYISIFVCVFKFSLNSHCVKNNVCKRLKDYYTIRNNSNCEYDVAADPNSDPTTIIMFYGYAVETHKVTTSDGYILTMFRIPSNEITSSKGPVLLQHGLMGSANNFLGLRKNSLAFILADDGYDVWLGNYRGTEYSEEHVNLTVFDKKYWDYSIDEIGLYDIPAQLDYISETTGNEGNIVYIGYSLGTTVGLVYASTFPEQARKKIKLLILIAPAGQATYIKAPLLKYFGPFYKPLLKIVMENNLIRFVSQAKILKALTRHICFKSPLLLQRCSDAFNYFITGPLNQLDPKTLPVAFTHAAAGSSLKIFVQGADFIMNHFRRYDYGLNNFKMYGSHEPPSFELKKIQVPVFLTYAIGDWATTAKDSLILYNKLPPNVRYGKYEITVPNFNHVDFAYGRNVKSILYDVLLQVINSFD